MHQVDRSRVNEILHDYRKECYLLEHRSGAHEQVEHERQRIVKELMALTHHFEFHRTLTPERAEIYNMIENYVRDAILPPIVSKLVERLVVLEKRQAAGIRCLERLISVIEEAEVNSER